MKHKNPELDFLAYFYSNWSTELYTGKPLDKYMPVAPPRLMKMLERLSSFRGVDENDEHKKARVMGRLLLISKLPASSVSDGGVS